MAVKNGKRTLGRCKEGGEEGRKERATAKGAQILMVSFFFFFLRTGTALKGMIQEEE